jgi:hypothetical protein
MTRLLGMFRWRIASDLTVVRLVQFACFAAAPALLIAALFALARLAATPGEVFLGVLASSAVALLLVILGLVLPLTQAKEAA